MVSDQMTLQQLAKKAEQQGELDYYNAAVNRLQRGKAAGSAGNPITRRYEREITFVSTGRLPKEEKVVGSVEQYNQEEIQKDIKEREAAGVSANQLIQQKINNEAAQKMSIKNKTAYAQKSITPPAIIVRSERTILPKKTYGEPTPPKEQKTFLDIIKEKRLKDYQDKYGTSTAQTGKINVNGYNIEYIKKPLTEEQKIKQEEMFGSLSLGMGRTNIEKEPVINRVIKPVLEIKQKVDKPLKTYVVEPIGFIGQKLTGVESFGELKQKIDTTNIGLQKNVRGVSQYFESRGVPKYLTKTSEIAPRALFGTGYYIARGGAALGEDVYQNPSSYAAMFLVGGATGYGLKVLGSAGTVGSYSARSLGITFGLLAATDLGSGLYKATGGFKFPKGSDINVAEFAGKKVGQYSTFALGSATGTGAYNYFNRKITYVENLRPLEKPKSTTLQDITNKRSFYSITGESSPPRVKYTTTAFRQQFNLEPLNQRYIPANRYIITTPQAVQEGAKAFRVNVYRGGKSIQSIGINDATKKLGVGKYNTELYISVGRNQPLFRYTRTNAKVSNINIPFKETKPTFMRASTAVREVPSGYEGLKIYKTITKSSITKSPISTLRTNTPIRTSTGTIIQFYGEPLADVGNVNIDFKPSVSGQALGKTSLTKLGTDTKVSLIALPKQKIIPKPVITPTKNSITLLPSITIQESKYSGQGLYEKTSEITLRNKVSPLQLREAIEPLSLQKSKNMYILSEKTDSSVDTGIKNIFDNRTNQGQENLSESRQEQESISLLRVGSANEQPLSQIDILRLTGSKTINIRTRKEPAQFKIKLPEGDARSKLLKMLSENETFKIFERRSGKDILIGKRQTKSEAVKLLTRRLKLTLSASGFIEKGKKKLSYTELGINDTEFRPSLKSNFRVVQKRNKRLGRRGETSEIQYFRKKSTKKNKFFGI